MNFALCFPRVSEEKEESVQKLRDEQGLFERKIQHLEQQNTLIIQERESILQTLSLTKVSLYLLLSIVMGFPIQYTNLEKIEATAPFSFLRKV